MRRSIGMWMLALALGGCGGVGTKPEDASAAEHEAAAREAQARADRPRTAIPRAAGRDVDLGERYVPSASSAEHAAQHREAARRLRDAEAAACGGVAEKARATCPLMRHPVLAVEALPDGVRVTYGGASAEALGRDAECHRAFGATEGREGMPGCPLYSKALRVRAEAVDGGAALVLTSDDPETVARVRGIYVPASR